MTGRRRHNKPIGTMAERRAANRLEGRATVGSGNKDDKADISLEHFLMESKATEYKSMGIKLEWLRKVSYQALDVNKYPALIIQFVYPTGEPVGEGSWVCIPEKVFNEILKQVEE